MNNFGTSYFAISFCQSAWNLFSLAWTGFIVFGCVLTHLVKMAWYLNSKMNKRAYDIFFTIQLVGHIQKVPHVPLFSVLHRRSTRTTWYLRKETSTSTLSSPEKHTLTHTSRTSIPTMTIKRVCAQVLFGWIPKYLLHHHLHYHHLMLTVVDMSSCLFAFVVICYEMWDETLLCWDHVNWPLAAVLVFDTVRLASLSTRKELRQLLFFCQVSAPEAYWGDSCVLPLTYLQDWEMILEQVFFFFSLESKN